MKPGAAVRGAPAPVARSQGHAPIQATAAQPKTSPQPRRRAKALLPAPKAGAAANGALGVLGAHAPRQVRSQGLGQSHALTRTIAARQALSPALPNRNRKAVLTRPRNRKPSTRRMNPRSAQT